MAIIYLRHPEHGEKVATLEAEAEADMARGWTVFSPTLEAAEKDLAKTQPTLRPRRPQMEHG